jgi:hypothetical protein
MHGKDQELTTELWSSSVRPEVVRRMRSTAAELQDAEPSDADWRLPCLLGLVEEHKVITTELWSFTAQLRVVSSDGDEHGWARVLVKPTETSERERKRGVLGFPLGGG